MEAALKKSLVMPTNTNGERYYSAWNSKNRRPI